MNREAPAAAINSGGQTDYLSMSLFSEIMTETGAPMLLEASGETIKVCSARGVVWSGLALVSEERVEKKQDQRGQSLHRERGFSIHVDPAGAQGGLAKVHESMTVEYRDRTGKPWKYDVYEVQSDAAGLVTILGRRAGLVSRSREGALGGT